VKKVILFLSSIALLTASSVHSVAPAPKGVVNSVATAKAEAAVKEASVQAIIQSVKLSPQEQAVVERLMNAKLTKELHKVVANLQKQGHSQERIEELVKTYYYLKAEEYFKWQEFKKTAFRWTLVIGTCAVAALAVYGVAKLVADKGSASEKKPDVDEKTAKKPADAEKSASAAKESMAPAPETQPIADPEQNPDLEQHPAAPQEPAAAPESPVSPAEAVQQPEEIANSAVPVVAPLGEPEQQPALEQQHPAAPQEPAVEPVLPPVPPVAAEQNPELEQQQPHAAAPQALDPAVDPVQQPAIGAEHAKAALMIQKVYRGHRVRAANQRPAVIPPVAGSPEPELEAPAAPADQDDHQGLNPAAPKVVPPTAPVAEVLPDAPAPATAAASAAPAAQHPRPEASGLVFTPPPLLQGFPRLGRKLPTLQNSKPGVSPELRV